MNSARTLSLSVSIVSRMRTSGADWTDANNAPGAVGDVAALAVGALPLVTAGAGTPSCFAKISPATNALFG